MILYIVKKGSDPGGLIDKLNSRGASYRLVEL